MIVYSLKYWQMNLKDETAIFLENSIYAVAEYVDAGHVSSSEIQ